MEFSIAIAGFGGQGVLFAGKLLAYAGMAHGKNVTWIPSYGPEMRGGTANCTVILSDSQIGAPIVSHPDIVLALNPPSFLKYNAAVKAGGLLVVNSSIVDDVSQRDDIDVVLVAANELAEREGNVKMLNMAMIGAMLASRPVLPLHRIESALEKELPASKQSLLPGNLRVLRAGFDAVQLTTN